MTRNPSGIIEIGNIRLYSHLIDQTKHCLILSKGRGAETFGLILFRFK